MTETIIKPVKNGSFRIDIPVMTTFITSELNCVSPSECIIKDKVRYNVPMISMNELADGWQQVVPKVRHYMKTITDENGVTTRIKCSNIFRTRVNLAQLPSYLWHRMQRYYKDGEFTQNYTVRNGIHYYMVERTNVDDEIRELANILKNPVEKSLKERVHELLNILKDNDVHGWVVVKANRLY
jgi:hypothetical protein